MPGSGPIQLPSLTTDRTGPAFADGAMSCGTRPDSTKLKSFGRRVRFHGRSIHTIGVENAL